MKKTGIIQEYIFKNSKYIKSFEFLKSLGSGLALSLPDNISLYDDDLLFSILISLKKGQSDYDLKSYPLWETECDYLSLLKNYFFNLLNSNTIFDNITNYIDVDKSVFLNDFITINILPKYKISNINLNTLYNDIFNTFINLKYKNNIVIDENIQLFQYEPIYIKYKKTIDNNDYFIFNVLEKENVNFNILNNIKINFKSNKNLIKYTFGYNICYNFTLI